MKTTHLYLLLTAVCILFLSGLAKATVEFNTGGSYIIDYVINDGISVTNGTRVTLTDGGWVKSVGNGYGAEGGSFTMTGGTVEGLIVALGNMPMFIYGGVIGGNLLPDSPGAGGQDGDVYIYGSDFKIDGVPVDYGVYHFLGQLTGTLSNGDLMDNYVGCSGGNDIILAPIPEPATLSLLTFGILAFLRRKA